MIDNSYFRRSINLPADNLENISEWITLYEKEILIKSLGFELYTEFIESLAESSPAQKWLDLRDGKVFETNEIQYKWNGLLNDEKESLISYYVFSQYVNDLSQQIGTAGVYKLLSENAEGVHPSNLVVNSWNKARKLQFASNESLFNFIYYTNLDSLTYDNWVFDALNPKNPYGI